MASNLEKSCICSSENRSKKIIRKKEKTKRKNKKINFIKKIIIQNKKQIKNKKMSSYNINADSRGASHLLKDSGKKVIGN